MKIKSDITSENLTSANSVALVDERSLKEKIYIVRGVQVMLDFELAEIYGYSTGKMNERVKENAEKFEGEEFHFQLTKDEYINLKSEKRISSWGGRRSLPYAFTEQARFVLRHYIGKATSSQTSKSQGEMPWLKRPISI